MIANLLDRLANIRESRGHHTLPDSRISAAYRAIKHAQVTHDNAASHIDRAACLIAILEARQKIGAYHG